MTEQTEVNPLRAMMVENIIAQNSDVPITVESLAPLLPDNFDLGEDDLERYREAHPTEPTPQQREAADMVQSILSGEPIVFEGETEQSPEAIGEAEAQAFNGHRERQRAPSKRPIAEIVADYLADTTETKPAPASPEAIEAAVIRRNKAEQDLANARSLQFGEDYDERALRKLLADAVVAFQAAFPPITRETLMKDYVASEQARKLNGPPVQRQSRPGNSYFDRSRFHATHGDAADFVRQSRPLTVEQAQKLVPGSTGPGTKGNARGAFPASMRDGPAKIHGER
jgi:hypothetical protein